LQAKAEAFALLIYEGDIKMTIVSSNPDWRDQHNWHLHETLVNRYVKQIFKLIWIPLVDVQKVGFENVPESGPCVMACNHISNFDPLFIGMYLPRHPHFMAKHTLYKKGIMCWLFKASGSFPVHRDRRDDWALQQASRVLRNNRLLFMFPEGTRSRNGAVLQRGKKGAVKLAIDHQASIVPVAIWGTQNIHAGLRNSNKVRIQFAPPLDVVKITGSPPYDQEVCRVLTDNLMRQIALMLPPEKRGIYA
jgi:1-acyl-sn-glycerol-3-phosphate acyltransferase